MGVRLFNCDIRASFVLMAAVALAAGLHPAKLLAASTITYVQGNSATPQATQASVTVPFSSAQTAGDLNVVVVGWNDTAAAVSTVTDKSGNSYALAVGPTAVSGYLSQSIYYAKNIAAAGAGANSVTVTFSTAAAYPDIRILEYQGADPNLPVDVTASASGSSATSTSAAATTTNPTDLIFGANIVTTLTKAAGSGFTKRLLTSPDGDIAEDKMVTATGSYSTTAPLTSSGRWIMQMVAFRTAGAVTGSFTVSASPTSLSIPQGAQGTSTLTATVSGGFSSSINFSAAGAPAGTTVSFNPSTIAAPGAGSSTMTIAVGSSTSAGTYPITVTATGGGLQQNATVTLTVTAAPAFTLSASPTSVTVAPGSQGTSTITTSVSGGFNNAIALSASGAPSGTTVSFNPASMAAPGTGSSTMTIAVGSSTVAGTYPITVTGNGGGVQQNATVTLTVQTAPTTISFVQGNYATPQATETAVTVPYTSPQIAGDLNVVVVGWNDTTATVGAVTDKSGNVYSLAVGPTTYPGYLSQSIYYARNIVAAGAGANTVTVTFATAAAYPDIRILEYSGANLTSPVDVTAAGTGSSTTSSTSTATTVNATDLILGADMVETSTKGPGSGFTQRLLTSPDGDIAEDEMVTTAGSYSASAALSSSGPWVMQMVAFSTAPQAPDTQPPTAPAALAATAVSESQINLSWSASTDNVGVTGYLVEREDPGSTSFAQVGTATSTNYNDTGLAAETNYSYRVRATDAAGNLSGYSPVASATTLAPDTQPPSAPGNLTAIAVSASQINVGWIAATDNVGVTEYRLERCQGPGCTNFVKLAYPTNTMYNDTGLAPNTSYSYIVRASDAAGNLGPYSDVASATTLAQPPSLVAAYSFDEGTGTSVTDVSGNGNNGTIANATWTTAGQYGNALVFNGTSALVTINDSASLHLTNGMTLEAWVNPSAVSSAWRDVVYKGADNYYMEGTSTSSGGLPCGAGTFGTADVAAFGTALLALNTWTHLAATYDGATLVFYVNGVQVSSLAQTGNIVTSGNPLQIGGDSIYGQYFQGSIDEVRVYNVALTAAQIQADMNTPLGNIPTAPGNLAATVVSDSQINLSWTASTESLGVAGYLVERCQGGDCTTFTQIGTTAGTTYSDNGLAANTSYSYRVRAFDTAGNLSSYSLVAQAYTGLSVSPGVAVLTFTGTQQFTGSLGSVTWSVDGVTGGSASSGTISVSGLYSPPGAVGTHVVTATSSDQSQSGNATVYVSDFPGKFTHHNDIYRTGQNLYETALTPANVNPATFGRLFSYPLDGVAHASPLYVANVSVPGKGYHNIVFVATEHDSVFAFDADGRSTSPLWQASFINPGAGVTTVPANDTGECCDIAPEIGITGTPVIDEASGTLYVVAKTKEVSGSTTSYVQRLHALDITTGAEKLGGPVVLQASVPGTGNGSQGGSVALNPLSENQRPALLLNNGVVYIGFASHGDNEPWHGWVLGYSTNNLAQVMAHNVTPNGYGGGIWQSGGGLGGDAAGSIYYVSGNGPFDANTGGLDYGDSFVKIGPSGAVLDYFTPYTQATLESQNEDLGSGGLLLLPDPQPGNFPHLMLSAGKDGNIYLVNRDNMGQYNTKNNSQIVQTVVNVFPNGTPEPGNDSAPVYFNSQVYFSPINDAVQAFKLTNGLLSSAPASRSSEIYVYPGGAVAISANGSASGILWAIQFNGVAAPGVLFAYDAGNLATELYNSNQAGTRDVMDYAAKFTVPLVANGKVFVASISQLAAYGLLP